MGLTKPDKRSIFYEDGKIYACLASFPIVRGHVVVVWKKDVKDLHLLSRKDFEYLMDGVDVIRNLMLKTLKIKKVYLIYMDEVNHVHWHLIPRYNVRGFNILKHKPTRLKDFRLVQKLNKRLN